MNSVKKMNELADKFAMKISRAQAQGAQASEVEVALKSAGLWLSPDQVAPLLNTAKVPEDAALDIRIVVNQVLAVKFQVLSTPPASKLLDENDPEEGKKNKQKNDMLKKQYQTFGNSLANVLSQKFAGQMGNALKKAQLSVTDTVEAKMVTFA